MTFQDPQKFMVALKVILINKKGECLLLKSHQNERFWKGKYDLPGGRINSDEIKVGFHEIINREIKEEVGLHVKYRLRQDPVSLSKSQFIDGRCIVYILFEAKYLSGKIQISGEHSECRWQKINSRNINKLFHPKFVELFKNYFNWNKSPNSQI